MLKGFEWVFVGIGANLGAPASMVKTALAGISEIAGGEIVSSSVWRSEALGMDGDDFANAVVKFEYNKSPLDLLGKLQALEIKHGRAPDHGHHTPRTLDLDIIAFGNRVVIDSRLSIPHPHAYERLFVLLPLMEIEPQFRFVDRDESLVEHIEKAGELRISIWED